MKILHTADWHVGRTLRNRSRATEHREVLKEIGAIALEEAVDLVIVAGDLFDSVSPTAESEDIVYEALLDLAATGAQVVVISGNHDHPHRLSAIAPLLRRVNVTAGALLARPESGGVISVQTKSGEKVAIALIPFLSQKGAVKADAIMSVEPAQNVLTYQEICGNIVRRLCEGLEEGCVQLAVAHLAVQGGKVGGGERAAHSIFEYYVPAMIFPATLHYVALGHLHAPQKIAAGCPMWYSGSPLQLDFGDVEVTNSVLLVEAQAGTPAEVRPIPLKSGRRLRQLKGTLNELKLQQENVGDDYLKLIVKESPRVGLADELRELFPNVVDVVVEYSTSIKVDDRSDHEQMTPAQLFRAYLVEENEEEDAVIAAFVGILEDNYASR